MKIAVCADHGAQERSNWSGTPWNFIHGLSQAGVETVSIDTLPPPLLSKAIRLLIAVINLRRFSGSSFTDRLSNSLIAAKDHPQFLGFCSLVTNIRLRRAGRVDAVLQMGTSFLARHECVFSYEDMTVLQALSLPNSHLQALSKKQKVRRIQRQKKVYQRLSGLLFATEWPALSAQRDYGIASEKIHVIGIGRNYSPQVAKKNWETPRFLFIGKNFIPKGGAGTVSAFVKIREDYPLAELAVVGNHPELVEPGVRCYGPLSLGNSADAELMDKLWGEATCLVVPALHEPAGIVFAEAASAGIPSIGSAIGGARFMIGEGGVVVDPGNLDELVSSMKQLSDPHYAQQLGSVAHSQSFRHEWPLIIEKLLDIIRKNIEHA